MTITMLDPKGQIVKLERLPEERLRELSGRKVGFVFNQHATGQIFWTAFEQAVTERFQPKSVSRVHKVNTWAPAPKPDIERLIGESDYVLVGLGA